MPAYVIIDIAIHDEQTYMEYVRRVRPIVEKFGGRYLARGGKIIPMAGDWNPQRIVLIEFDSSQRVRECFGSPEYLAVAPFREQSTHTRAIIVEGI